MVSESDGKDHEQLISYARDLSVLYQKERNERQQLGLVLNRIRTVFDSISEGILIVDVHSIIQDVNSSFFAITRNKVEDITGRSLQDYFCSSPWDSLLSEELSRDSENEFVIKCKKPFEFVLRVIRTPVVDKSGECQGWLYVFYDETERRKMGMMRDEFLSLVVKEINTPLDILNTFIPYLVKDKTDAAKITPTRSMEVISQNIKLISRTLDELRDMAQSAVEASAVRETFDLCEIISHTVDMFRAKMQEHEIEIQIKEIGAQHWIYGFPELIERSMRHLFDHLLTVMTGKSQITVSIQSIEQDCLVTIKSSLVDTRRDRVHEDEAFAARTKKSKPRKTYWHSITKKVALLHGGFFSIKLILGGYEFYLRLPETVRDDDPSQETERDVLKKQISALQAQNIQYAKDLAQTYTQQKQFSSQLTKTTKQLVRSDKLALMGQMIAAVSHEMNNRLNPIIGYTDIMLTKKDLIDERIIKWVNAIQESAWRALDMLNQLLDFSRKKTSDFQYMDLVGFIDDVLEFLAFKIKTARVQLIKEYEPNKIMVFANRGELEQVIVNLVVNALDAMEGGGSLTISLKRSDDTTSKDEAYAEMVFKDTGPGIAPGLQEKVFEPFFTTKDEGKGTGLGLFIIHNIVEKHGGIIEIESKPPQGTAFIIRLPLPTHSFMVEQIHPTK